MGPAPKELHVSEPILPAEIEIQQRAEEAKKDRLGKLKERTAIQEKKESEQEMKLANFRVKAWKAVGNGLIVFLL